MVLSPYPCARRGAFAPPEKVFRARRALTLFGVSMISALIAVSSRAEAAHVTSKLQVLYAFRDFKGTNPIAGLIADAKGNFYGTAVSGGAHDDGVVFELSPPAPGQTAWTETVLHSFSGADGQSPDTALIADKAGNLYGAAELGGANGVGTVFELSPPREGKKAWAGTVLYSFGRVGGSIPAASLIADEAGNLYGTANNGGARGEGVVFELSPPTGGESAWTETVLHSFHGADGMGPLSGLLADGAGNLYGTAQEGGDYGYGVAYRLSPPAVGRTAWAETVLHTFKRSDGQAPGSSLIADSAGNLYGTTLFGGPHACPQMVECGVVFELSPPAPGRKAWTQTVLRGFNGTRGYQPYAGVLMDVTGNLFGVTYEGGPKYCKLGCGVVFELSPPAAGLRPWTETMLHAFNGGDGQLPIGNLIEDGSGNLYGTTQIGGAHAAGVVFKVTP